SQRHVGRRPKRIRTGPPRLRRRSQKTLNASAGEEAAKRRHASSGKGSNTKSQNHEDTKTRRKASFVRLKKTPYYNTFSKIFNDMKIYEFLCVSVYLCIRVNNSLQRMHPVAHATKQHQPETRNPITPPSADTRPPSPSADISAAPAPLRSSCAIVR